MKFIAHRGNLSGRICEKENTCDYILHAINNGFDVEIDVWCLNDETYLGHDSAVTPVDKRFILDNEAYLWCHAKNKESLQLLNNLGVHFFWHEQDKYTITSKGYIWLYPHSCSIEKCIVNQPEWIFENNTKRIAEHLIANKTQGVCSDFIQDIREQCNLTT